MMTADTLTAERGEFNFTMANYAKKIDFFFCFVGFGVFVFCFAVRGSLLHQVLGLRELGVDNLGGLVVATHPLILLSHHITAAVADVGLALDDRGREGCDILVLLSRSGRRSRDRLGRSCGGRLRASRLGRDHSLATRSLGSLGRSALDRGSSLGLLALRLARLLLGGRGGRRSRSGRHRRDLSGRRLASLRHSGLALLGRRPALEAADDVLVSDRAVVRLLLTLLVLLEKRQLSLEHRAVLLSLKALELAASCQQNLANVLREGNPGVGVLLGRQRVLNLLLLLGLLGASSDSRRQLEAAVAERQLHGRLHKGLEVGARHGNEHLRGGHSRGYS